MQLRESQIHFSRWIFDGKERNSLKFILISLVIHTLCFLLLYYTKPKKEVSADQNQSSVKVNFKNSSLNQKLVEEKKNQKKQPIKKEILTDNNLNSKSNFYSNPPKNQDLSNSIPQQSKERTLDSFLPNSNPNYPNSYYHRNPSQQEIITDDENIVDEPSLAPTNKPRIMSRFVEKEMSLFQFSQEFMERFGAIWNSQDRVVPPNSPLKPGDVVYYEVYVKSNGTMEKYINLSKKDHPNINYDDVDAIFMDVISHVFPMNVPPKFANKNIVITKLIPIRVVGRNTPLQLL